MLIDHDQFHDALVAASSMSAEHLRGQTGSGRSRSYFVRANGRTFPMKAIMRLAYMRAGIGWDGPQSRDAAAELRPRFDIVHVTGQAEEERLRRQRESVERWARPGQGRFRAAVIELYDGTCPISGCDVLEVLDASHLQGVADDGDDHARNGWLLRTDLHRLFDALLMSIDPETGHVVFAPEVAGSYRHLDRLQADLPEGGPRPIDFMEHWQRFSGRGTAPDG